MTIAGCDRALPLCKLNDDLMIGAFVIFGDQELTVACAISSEAPWNAVISGPICDRSTTDSVAMSATPNLRHLA